MRVIEKKRLHQFTNQTRMVSGKGIPLEGRTFMIWGAMGSTMLFLVVWSYFPLVYAFIRSFTNWQPLLPDFSFVGLANYREVLFNDRQFWKALWNTIYFSLGNVIIGTAVCLFFALLLNSVKRFRSFFRFVYFLPTMMGIVSLALIWQFMFQQRFGILNFVLKSITGLVNLPPLEIPWLTRPEFAMNSLILMTIWTFMGFRIMLFIAGLQGIPETIYESARIDGAGSWALFRYITFPLLVPTLAYVLVIGTINSMQVFEQMFIMTNGGPMDSTRSLVQLIYDKAFTSGLFRFGYSSAMSFVLGVILMVLTYIQLRVTRTNWEY